MQTSPNAANFWHRKKKEKEPDINLQFSTKDVWALSRQNIVSTVPSPTDVEWGLSLRTRRPTTLRPGRRSLRPWCCATTSIDIPDTPRPCPSRNLRRSSLEMAVYHSAWYIWNRKTERKMVNIERCLMRMKEWNQKEIYASSKDLNCHLILNVDLYWIVVKISRDKSYFQGFRDFSRIPKLGGW